MPLFCPQAATLPNLGASVWKIFTFLHWHSLCKKSLIGAAFSPPRRGRGICAEFPRTLVGQTAPRPHFFRDLRKGGAKMRAAPECVIPGKNVVGKCLLPPLNGLCAVCQKCIFRYTASLFPDSTTIVPGPFKRGTFFPGPP